VESFARSDHRGKYGLAGVLTDGRSIFKVMISRSRLVNLLRARLRSNPAVVLLGHRQCGKTTIARQVTEGAGSTYFDLEKPTGLVRLEQPMTALEPLRGLVVIDEVQRRPDLFPVLRVLLDRNPVHTRFLGPVDSQ
jgi:hypothetical protein